MLDDRSLPQRRRVGRENLRQDARSVPKNTGRSGRYKFKSKINSKINSKFDCKFRSTCKGWRSEDRRYKFNGRAPLLLLQGRDYGREIFFAVACRDGFFEIVDGWGRGVHGYVVADAFFTGVGEVFGHQAQDKIWGEVIRGGARRDHFQ